LIDATSFKTPLRKNLGKKNCEVSFDQKNEIVKLLTDFKENEFSKIFRNEEFLYWSITVERPKVDEAGNTVKDKKGNPKADADLRDVEQVPYLYEGGIEAFMKNEVLPYSPDAWVDDKKTKTGCELSFTKYFYKPVELRSLDEIVADIRDLEKESDGLLDEILRD
jgi:type I restriction enzyme M protein